MEAKLSDSKDGLCTLWTRLSLWGEARTGRDKAKASTQDESDNREKTRCDTAKWRTHPGKSRHRAWVAPRAPMEQGRRYWQPREGLSLSALSYLIAAPVLGG